MKIFHKIVQSALLFTTPALIAYPASEIPRIPIQYMSHLPIQIPDLRTLSYDEVVDLLSKIESDSLEEKYSIDELDQINQFISFLAMEGVVEDEKIEMGNAVASLFRNDAAQYALWFDSGIGYSAKPALYFGSAQDFFLCKSWIQKQWDQTRSFVKKHKKAIIIGAIVVVTVAIVVTVVAISATSAAAATAATAAGGALASASDSSNNRNSNPPAKEPSSNESFPTSLHNQISAFKETVAIEQFAAAPESNGISFEDNGRIVGSLFAHQMVDSIEARLTQNPSIANELKNCGLNGQYPIPRWVQTYPDSFTMMPHPSTDLAFSTDYTTSYGENVGDLNGSVYQARGHMALNSECYTQAVQDFGSAISLNPSNPVLYLERGIANFELGHYEQSIDDYNQFIEKKAESFSVTDFTLGFAKGVSKGAYESGKGSLLFLSDFIAHPVQTSKQILDSISQLAALVKNDEFGVIAETLSPELYLLVNEWDTLSSERRGELAGYAIGKLGADILAPGAAIKVASKSVKSGRELAAIYKNLQMAQETLILETAAHIGVPAKISEIVEMGKKTVSLGEELGFSSHEIGQLQKAGTLTTSTTNAYEHLSPGKKKSHRLFENAQSALEKHKGFMTESQARELIHETGIKTFPRPPGIPENFRVKLSNNGAGIKYVHPTDEGTYVRVMPGKPHSMNPYQQKPYITYQKNGNSVNKHGSKVDKNSLEAHIPYEEFIYRE